MFKIINFRRSEQNGGILANFDVQVGESFIIKDLKLAENKKSGERFVSPRQEEFEWKGKTMYRHVGFSWVYEDKERTEKSQQFHDQLLAMAEEALETAPEPKKRQTRQYRDDEGGSRNSRQSSDNGEKTQKSGGFSF